MFWRPDMRDFCQFAILSHCEFCVLLRILIAKMGEVFVNNPELVSIREVLYLEGAPYSGFVKEYYDSGAKRSITQYYNGQLHGITKMWYESGKLSHLRLFKEGKAHGEFRTYWRNGVIKSSSSYYHGKRHGLCESWYDNGVMMCCQQYVMGKRWGVEKRWDDKGRSISNLAVSSS